jgi:alpha-glucosidase (family GH31 glycosyl hydrolase)
MSARVSDRAFLIAELFPYNYSLAWEAHRYGTPLMRPLVLEFPGDPNVTDMASEYMWGPSLLVAPVTRGGATHWPVYLPRGTWYDYWTARRYEGGCWMEVDAPLERMPLFVRGGAVSRDYLEGRYTLTTLRCSTVGDDVWGDRGAGLGARDERHHHPWQRRVKCT